MRLSIFVVLAFAVAFGVGLASAIAGASLWASVGRAVLTLVVLQVVYFLFLINESRKSGKSQLGDNGE